MQSHCTEGNLECGKMNARVTCCEYCPVQIPRTDSFSGPTDLILVTFGEMCRCRRHHSSYLNEKALLIFILLSFPPHL